MMNHAVSINNEPVDIAIAVGRNWNMNISQRKATSNILMNKFMPCPECGCGLVLKTGRHGPFYGCLRWPDCPGSHKAHADGRPMGVPADAETKKWRIEAHRAFDSFWKKKGMRRKKAYGWLGEVMGLSKQEAHIARFDKGRCQKLMKVIGRLENADRNSESN